MSPDDSDSTESGYSSRRSVLRALGVGTTAAAIGGTGVASAGHADRSGRPDAGSSTSVQGQGAAGDCPPCIDDLSGYASLSMELDVPAALQPDHTVEMRLDDADVLFPEEGDTGSLPEGPSLDPENEDEPEGFPDFYFDPVAIEVSVGDVVEFPNPSPGEHTVSAIHPRFFGLQQRIPDGASPFSSPPVLPQENWLYRFDEFGVYDMFCIPHFELGMVTRVVVTNDDDDCGVPSAPELSEDLPPTVRAVLGAEALEPANVISEGPVAWTDLKGEIPTFNPDELFGE